MHTGCTKTPGSSNTCDTACPGTDKFYTAPFTLRLMQWDCAADCSYHCMWAIEGPKAAAATGPIQKYHGKWPFIRVTGAQEIASVLFSIINMVAHLHNLMLYVKHVKSLQPAGKGSFATGSAVAGAPTKQLMGNSSGAGLYPYSWLWVVYALVNINAWVWSTIFHCRDTRVTEKLDYFSANFAVAFGLGVAVARTLQMHSPLQLAVLAILLLSGLAQHMYYMAFIKFDYGYNMKLCIAVGIATAVTWLVWVTAVRHPGRRIVYHFMVLVHLAMLLEVLDFPPLWWLLDAHALWHAATVPLTYLWYKFLFADVAFVAGSCGGLQLGHGGGGGFEPAAGASASAEAGKEL